MGEAGYPYPVLVRANWGPKGFSKTVKNKLQCYFQKQKRSGGGECHVTVSTNGQPMVHFAEEEARGRVLAKSVHEVDLPERGNVVLEVEIFKEPDEEPPKLVVPPQVVVPPSIPNPAPGDLHAPPGEELCFCSSLLITVSGDTVGEDVLEMYFENKKRSGGGPIKSCSRDGQGVRIIFENVKDAQEVLSQKTHFIENIQVQVEPCRGTCVGKEQPSSSVVLENIPVVMTPEMLIMLIENTSDLGEEDFNVEFIPEINASVVTLRSSDGVMDFVQRFTQSNRVKNHSITARILECTKSIKAENLPTCVNSEFLSIYFESSKHGGGRVSNVELFPEENSAIITFCDQEAIEAVLSKPHMMNKEAFPVYPYYSSLDTALYGKDRPVIKLPNPIRLAVNTFIWQYLEKNQKRMYDINKDMGDYYCEITWPQSLSSCIEVILAPSALLSKKRKVLAKLAKTWNEQVTTKFSSIMSQYKATEYSVNPVVWEAMQEKVNNAVETGVLVLPDVTKSKVALAGIVESVVRMERHFTEILQQTNKTLERTNQSVTEHVRISPAVYAILCNAKLEESIRKMFPDMTMSYDDSVNLVSLVGLRAEVYGAKSEILDRERTLKQKTINPSPLVLHFIQTADNEELSYNLFTAKKINAVCKTQGNMVLLLGNTQDAIEKAEHQIKEEIIFKCIALDDRGVIELEEWRTLKCSLMEAFNSGRRTFSMKIEEAQVAIVGYSGVVPEVHEQVANFVDQNTQIQMGIPLQYKVVEHFLKEEKRPLLLEIEKKNIKIDFKCESKQKQICLYGPRRDVLDVAQRVHQVLNSLHSKVLTVNKPGAKKFCQNLDETCFIAAKQKYKCCVKLMKDGEDYEEECGVEPGLPCYHVRLPGGIDVGVYKDDLCKHPVNVVVNASNEDLQHIGALALALSKAAGPQLQADSDTYVHKHGKLNPGDIAVTSGWNLPCQHVVHAVGPRWDEYRRANSERLLKTVIQKCLGFAESNNHSSIAIPAVSSGIFGFPLDLCVDCIVLALKEHLEARRGKSSLQQIHFVDSKQESVRAFIGALKKHFGDSSPSKPVTLPRIHTKKETAVPRNQEAVQEATTKEGLTITVKQGNIEEASTDVIVNSISKDLQLDQGGVSKALLRKAGARLQHLVNEAALQENIDIGSVLPTDGLNLSCQKVFHVISPYWGSQEESEEALEDVIKDCLKLANEMNLKSITFPAIGTGNLGFPKDVVASLMISKVCKTSKKKKFQSLQEVHFMLHPSDKESIREFSDELEKWFGGKITHKKECNRETANIADNTRSVQGSGCIGEISVPTLGVYEMQIGPIKLQVKSGDITKESADIIVNSTNSTFNLRNGVSKAILDAAGQAVDTECAQKAALPNNGYIITTNGGLPCQNIIHVVGQTDPQKIKTLVQNVLNEVEQLQCTSVAFPALGTGQGGANPSLVADSILDALIDFASQKKAQSVTKVTIIIFQPQMLEQFHTCMKKKQGTSLPEQKSLFSRMTCRIGAISVPTLGVYEMQIGPIKLQVKSGDITKESADIIVNSTNSTFNLRNGVSKAILEAAGQAVDTECAQKAALPNNGYIITTNGGLPCQNIIHVVGQTDPQKIKTLFQNVLNEVERLRCTSVAFPALGTGQGGANPSLVADSIIDALIDFAIQKKAQSVTKVTIVIFQSQMIEQFHTCLKNKQAATAAFLNFRQPVVKKNTNLVLKDRIEPANVQICGESKKNVDDTASCIEELILREHCVNVIHDDCIAEFDEPEFQKLTELQNTFKVQIQVKHKQEDSFAEVGGLTRDVITACTKIEEMIKKTTKEFGEKRHAELISNLVQWYYEEGQKYFPFDKLANARLEEASVKNQNTVEIQSGRRRYKVDLSSKSAKYDKNEIVKIHRKPKTEENEIPPHWDNLRTDKVELVILSPQTKEYQDVQALFSKTCGLGIQKIERVQNIFLWKNYMVKKMSIDQKNGNKNNENQLFHGTAEKYLKTINNNGFNRSFAGMNAACYGNGTYFAVNANYSASNTYSKPDATGMKYMYLTRVLTGMFSKGSQGIVTPPAKTVQDPTDLYDSVTDNVTNPTMFVIFNDVQAYPEYLISFK